MNGTLNPQPLLTVLQWIAEKARSKTFKFWTLAHHITPELLRESFGRLNKQAAPGIDGQKAKEYEENLEENLKRLHTTVSERRYRAPAIKRVWIPKGDDSKKLRPLGLTTLEDKILQGAVVRLLEGIYEADFHEFSYGYRRGKSCHQALETLWKQLMSGMQWVIDADISDYFTSIDHAHLREFLSQRIADQSIMRIIGKWLNAGVLEDKTLTYPKGGVPQGGVVSPLLSNVYLHYVLDEWFVKEVKPRLRGRAFLVRVADDFVIGCDYEGDARRIMEVLPKRMQKYGLTIHPTKTRLLNFSKPSGGASKGASTFDFLGLRHYWGKSRKGNWVVQRKTSPKRLRRAMRGIRNFCREKRHAPVKWQHQKLCAKLRGHYNYFGVTGNCKSLQAMYLWAKRQWHKWLNRRGAKPRSWERFQASILTTYRLLPPRVVHSALAAAG